MLQKLNKNDIYKFEKMAILWYNYIKEKQERGVNMNLFTKEDSNEKTYYVTTPIFYASGKPQLGNAYSAVLADSIARYKKLKGYNVVFQTGMDEHGQKVELTAKKNNKKPQDFVDEISLEVKRVLESVNVDYDTFARTTNPKHKEIVQKIFQKLSSF